MAELGCLLIFLPNLDGLVSLARNESGSRQIKLGRINAILGIQTSRLSHGLRLLEVVSRGIVPEIHRAIIGRRHEDAIVVHGQGIHNGLVTGQILDESSIASLPLLQSVCCARNKGILKGRHGQGTDTLLVMRQGRHAFARGQIPQFDGGIVRSGDNLRIGRFGQQRSHRVVVTGQAVDLVLGPHIPHPGHGIATAGHQQVQGGMELEREDAAQMPVIVPHDLIGFQIPALDLLVLAGTEQVGMSGAEGQAADGTDVPREGNLERIGGTDAGLGQVKDLDDPIGTAGGKHVVGGVEGDGPHPAQMRRQDGGEAPRRVPLGRWYGGCFRG